MLDKKKYETMTELDFLNLVHNAVAYTLEEVREGKEVPGIPKLTIEQLDSISYESSFNAHRVIFSPEENRQVTLTITAEEFQE